MALTLWKNSDGDLLKKDGQLIKCDRCPCGGGLYSVWANCYYVKDGIWKPVFIDRVDFKVGNYNKTIDPDLDVELVTFENAPWPTKEQPLYGSVNVYLLDVVNSVNCDIAAVSPNNTVAWSQPFNIMISNPSNQFRNEFTIGWRNGDMGETWYLDWTY